MSNKYLHTIRLSFFPDKHIHIWRDYPPTDYHECCEACTNDQQKEWRKDDASWISPESDSESLPDIDEKKK